ncbi:MAG: GAF domain-containing sensor histidine kinase [Gemmatimonadales bacterium]|nr:GAF domain-containing sensor histidine kinase [Gemmatimonadales bacterium]
MPSSRSRASQKRLERLLSAGLELTSELSLDGVLHRVAELACEIIGARYAAMGLLAPDGKSFQHFVAAGIDPDQHTAIGALPKGLGILGLVMREQKILRLEDLTTHPKAHGFPPKHPPMRSFLGVPITGRRGVIGNLYITEKIEGRRFTDEDEYIARLMAAQAAAAVENARLHDESARLLEEVQQLHRSRERFFAMVNHELRNALAGTYGWAELLVRRKDPASVPRAAFEVLDSAEQAVSLINDLLDLSRLDEDRLRPKIEQAVPAAVVRKAIGRVTPAADAKPVSLEFRPEDDIPTCSTDAQRVEQILVNLLTNAIHHTARSTTVRTTLTVCGDACRVMVDDEGPGIPKDELERVFDIYGTKPRAGSQGTGIGLPLSRRLARLLGGDLWAENRANGRGARFVLELPHVRRRVEPRGS